MVRNPHAGQPFTTSDEEIAEALLDVSIPTLMLSLVHMSGDPSLIRGELRPAGLFLNEVQGIHRTNAGAAARGNSSLVASLSPRSRRPLASVVFVDNRTATSRPDRAFLAAAS